MRSPETRLTDRWVGFAIVAAAIPLFIVTFWFPVIDWAPLGMAFWPRLLIGLLCALAAGMIAVGRFGGEEPGTLSGRALGVLAGSLAYVFLLTPVGYLIVTPVYLAALNLALATPAQRSWLEAALVALGGTAVTYGAFQYGLGIELPAGIVGELI